MSNVALKYFVVTAEELNITRAANRLFISQQALSEQIKKLERQYGAVFFQRGHPFRLTYQGEQMLAYAKSVLAAETRLVDYLQEDKALRRIRMNIGVTSTRGIVLVPMIFAQYHRLCPNVVLSVTVGVRESILDQLRMSKFDVYLGMLDGGLMSGQKAIPLYRDELYFIISQELLQQYTGNGMGKFLTQYRNGISIDCTRGLPVALPPGYSRLRALFDRQFSDSGITPNVVLETTNHDILFDVCQAGICCCFVSREMLYRKLKHKSLPANVYFFPMRDITGLSSFGVVYSEKDFPEHIRKFVSCCKDTVRQMTFDIDKYMQNGAPGRI